MFAIACISYSLVYADKIHIVNSENEPLGGVTLYILSQLDSSIIDSVISDDYGNADLPEGLDPEDYIHIRLYGYKALSSRLKDINDSVILEHDVTELNEVVISASADLIKSESGKFTIYPGSLKTEVPGVSELLKFVPMLLVSEKTLSFIGDRPAKIYINGKDIKIPEEFIIPYLNSLNPAEIKRIDLIPDGDSASGNAGIINIELDDQSQGLKGVLRVTANYEQERPSNSDFLSLNFAKGKFKSDLIINYRFGNSLSSNNTEYNYIDSGIYVTNKTNTSKKVHQLSGQFKLSYTPSDRDDLGLWFNLGSSKSNSISNVDSETIRNNIAAASEFKSSTTIPWQRPVFRIVAFWTHKTDSSGSLIDLTADYYDSKNSYENDYLSDATHDIQSITNYKRGLHFNGKYTQAIGRKNFITGAYDITASKLRYSDIGQNYSDDLKYSEIINSASLSWMALWNESIRSSVNFIYEHTDLKGIFHTGGDNFKRTFNSWMPNANISFYIPNRSQSISLGGGMGVDRPVFSFLNPEIVWTSGTTYYTGNPDLETSKIWYASADYSILNCIFINANLTHIQDIVSDYTYMNGDYTVSSYANTGRKTSSSLNIQYINTFWNVWRLNASLLGMYDYFRGSIEDTSLDYNHFSGVLSIYNMIILSRKHNFNVSIDYRYISPIKEITSNVSGRHLLNVGLYKSFKNGMSLSFNAGNLLAQRTTIRFSNLQYGYVTKNLGFPLTFSLRFDYIFGKKRIDTGITRNRTKMDER